jgi:hypothetical protein
MTEFGKTLFGGSRFIFWSLAPAIVIFLVAIPFLVPKWTSGIVLMLMAFWIVGVALILGMLNPSRFGWAFRVVGAMVFLIYVAYALAELVEHNWKLIRPRSRGEANPVNALIGLVVIGGPALMYAVLGRFSLRKEEDEPFEVEDIDGDSQGTHPWSAREE